jgi:hypothetical protein
MDSATNCNSPRGSYTAKRPRTTTKAPSVGAKSSMLAARLNSAQRMDAAPVSLSFSVK